MPVLSRIPPAVEDIDVSFFGSVNDRRKAELEDIAGHGKNVAMAYNSYGEQQPIEVGALAAGPALYNAGR